MKLDAKWMGFALAGAALSGCGAILGLDEFKEGSGGSSTGTGTGTGGMASSTSAVTGSGECTGVESRTCYDFGAATLGEGVCKGGMKTCKDGVFGACEGQVGPSTEDCSKPEDENCDGVACSEAIWSKEFGDVSSVDKNFAAAEDLVVLANGHILITGVFTSSINFGPTPATSLVCTPGHSNLFLAELGPDGSHIWSERFETQGDAVLDARMAVSSTGQIFLSAFYKEAITLDGKVITATGSDGRDFFIASFDKDGKVLWGDTFGLDSQAGVLDLAVFPDGDPIIVGQYGNGTLALGSTTYLSLVGYNAFVARIGHLDGSVVWSRSYGDNPNDLSGDQSATAVAVDAAGNVVVAGTFNATIDLDGGFQGLAPEGGLDVFVAQVDSKGDPVWHTSFHGATNEVVSSVALEVFTWLARSPARLTSTPSISRRRR